MTRQLEVYHALLPLRGSKMETTAPSSVSIVPTQEHIFPSASFEGRRYLFLQPPHRFFLICHGVTQDYIHIRELTAMVNGRILTELNQVRFIFVT